ncbi:hypothetical protein GCM10023083_79890 [Streptomyces phyllanthi]
MRGAWLPPLASTLTTLPLALFAFGYAGLSPMACDSCNGAEADRFTESFDVAFTVLSAGLVASLILLVLSWCLPWTRRYASRRGILAVGAPAMVLIAFVMFLGLVRWPS